MPLNEHAFLHFILFLFSRSEHKATQGFEIQIKGLKPVGLLHWRRK